MCVSSERARFTGTRIMIAEAYRRNRLVNAIAYQNRPINLSDKPNAMLLHFPAQAMTQENSVDATSCPNILRDQERALTPSSRRGLRRVGMSKGVEVFDVGIYTVVLAQSASDIPGALNRVPAQKRPVVSEQLFEFYAKAYAGWPVALCCFNNRDTAESAPLMFWYDPLYTDRVHAPAIDSHTGAPPELGDLVDVDHFITFGSPNMRGGTEVTYTDRLPKDVRELLPTRIIGQKFSGRMQNGDFESPTQSLLSGSMRQLRRVLPPAIG